MKGRRLLVRRITSAIMLAGAATATVVAMIPLFSTLYFVISRGLPALDLGFLTSLPAPVGDPGGGMANAIAGSFIVLGIACLFGLPVGIGTGVYLAEYGRNRVGGAIRFVTDVLTGVPSIVVGIFAYVVIVLATKSFSALAGGLALAVIMVPLVARTTEEMIRLVPVSLREAGLALGVPYWRVLLTVVLRAARGGIITGFMLAVARAAGETAPLLFTSASSTFWSMGIGEPVDTLPVRIFLYAISPYEEWHTQAWAGSLVLVATVLSLSILARLFARGQTAFGRR